MITYFLEKNHNFIFFKFLLVFFLFLLTVIIIPQRYVFGILGLFALANAYTMRVCLSVTIVQMVTRAPSEGHIVGETCPEEIIVQDSSNTSSVFVPVGNKMFSHFLTLSNYTIYIFIYIPYMLY